MFAGGEEGEGKEQGYFILLDKFISAFPHCLTTSLALCTHMDPKFR